MLTGRAFSPSAVPAGDGSPTPQNTPRHDCAGPADPSADRLDSTAPCPPTPAPAPTDISPTPAHPTEDTPTGRKGTP